ncbi:MAG TPA: nucleotide sugar dehydrogenase [Streptosporangiaceae bacterium]|nr:nucleotide sugar dehydrogenase [Streptosporangiaceae bacterium]
MSFQRDSAARDSRALGAFDRDVVIVGGCGHVGLPLAIALASRGASVTCYDIDAAAVAAVAAGRLPFAERGAALPLRRAVAAGTLTASTDPAVVAAAEHVVVVILGEEGSDPAGLGPSSIAGALRDCAGWLRDGQLLVLRSTVSPGATAVLEKLTAELGIDADVAFCPERIAEGRAMTELFELPQIISSRSARGLERARELFGRLTAGLIELSPEEAELAKLFSNAWRYIKFAAANEMFMIASDRNLDFERIRAAVSRDYPRAADLPPAGFAAGPCLLKDTAGLAAASRRFTLGAAAIGANEGLPGYVVAKLAQRYPLSEMTVGVLGMAFKAGSDDSRASLSYPVARLLTGQGARVLCTDPYVCEPGLVPLARVLAAADLLVIATPHPQYAGLAARQPVADIWGVTGAGVPL